MQSRKFGFLRLGQATELRPPPPAQKMTKFLNVFINFIHCTCCQLHVYIIYNVSFLYILTF
jgi:hypothetical protein